MWVTSGWEMALPASSFSSASVYSRSAISLFPLLLAADRSGGLGDAAFGQFALDQRLHRLVDLVEEQQRHRRQERQRAVQADRQADAVDGFRGLRRQVGVVAVVGEDAGDQRAAHAQAHLQAAQDGRE